MVQATKRCLELRSAFLFQTNSAGHGPFADGTLIAHQLRWICPMRVLLTHNRDLLKHFYSPKAVDLLRSIVDLRMNDSDAPLIGEALVAAAQGCQAILSDRLAAGPREVLERLKGVKAFIRCAVDIRNIDVDAASDN